MTPRLLEIDGIDGGMARVTGSVQGAGCWMPRGRVSMGRTRPSTVEAGAGTVVSRAGKADYSKQAPLEPVELVSHVALPRTNGMPVGAIGC